MESTIYLGKKKVTESIDSFRNCRVSHSHWINSNIILKTAKDAYVLHVAHMAH